MINFKKIRYKNLLSSGNKFTSIDLDRSQTTLIVGTNGSGKSTIGRGLSKKLGLDFYDTDKEIEKEMGQKIAKIFDESGESIFRNIEKKITLKLLDKKNSIIALGGGGFEDLKIRKLISVLSLIHI